MFKKSVLFPVLFQNPLQTTTVDDYVNQTFSSYWMKKQWLPKLSEDKWLMTQNGKLGSKVFCELRSLDIHKIWGEKLCME
jgi:hypothetical protein